MNELPRCYTVLFEAVEQAILAINAQNYGLARQYLIQGQQNAEEAYLAEDE